MDDSTKVLGLDLQSCLQLSIIWKFGCLGSPHGIRELFW